MIRAYRFALDPTDAQAEALRSHCGGQRYAYNWGLAGVKANLDQRDAERSYGLADADLTPMPRSLCGYAARAGCLSRWRLMVAGPSWRMLAGSSRFLTR